MTVQENISLKPYNTFGLDVKAKKFIEVQSERDLLEVLWAHAPQELFVLGGGSNLLLTQDLDKTVIKLNLTGKNIIEETIEKTVVCAGAGENWHEFVLWTIEQNLGGLENLSLIPGNVGTAPIQNIGAYGVEIKDTFKALEAVEIETGKSYTFSKKECAFGYRDSVFKKHAKGQYIITKVFFELSNNNHVLHTNYGAIKDELSKNNIEKPSIKDVSNAVIAIRQSKLPNPKEIGNSGSFFKNPVMTNTAFAELKLKFPEVSAYPNGPNHTKVAAGWLIEKAGWKGYREEDFGVHAKQALVLVNYGSANGSQIYNLAQRIIASVLETFNIELEAEVNIL